MAAEFPREGIKAMGTSRMDIDECVELETMQMSAGWLLASIISRGTSAY